jgi:hypothetical protein
VDFLILLWPLSGVIAHWVATPYWMRQRDPVGFAVMHLAGAVVGPFGFLWLLVAPYDNFDRRLDEEAHKRNRK